jgi:hypothetical protein
MTGRRIAMHPNLVADRLGISVDSVYERIRSGDLVAEKHDGRWLVLLEVRADADSKQASNGHRDHDAQQVNPESITGGPLQPEHLNAITDQLAEQGIAIKKIQEELIRVQSQYGSRTASANGQSTPVRTTNPSPVPTREGRRGRPQLVVLSAIVALIVGAMTIQAGPAERSDDLTVIVVFACGAVTGAIASWMALDKQRR